MATRYLTVANFKTYLRSELTLEDTLYDNAINAGELWIDGKLGRKMIVASATTARTFRPLGNSRTLVINDCTAVTSVVENGSTLVSGTAYELEPLNGLSDAGEVWPYYKLVKPYNVWFSTNNLASVVVTATWGWAAIPQMVYEACAIVAKDYFEQRDVSHGIIGVSDVGGVGTRENRLVRDMITKYRHPNSWGLAA